MNKFNQKGLQRVPNNATELSKDQKYLAGTLGRWVSEDNIPRGFEIALKLMFGK